MSSGAKAAIALAVLAVLGAVAVVAGSMTGLIPASGLIEKPDRVLVVLVAPDESGTDVAAVAYVSDADDGSVVTLDPLAEQPVPGTSARSAREAFAFGGGDTASRALRPQVGSERLEWVVIRASEWSKLIDAAGGVEVALPQPLNAYARGRLVTIPAGPQRLDGAGSVIVVGALPFLEGGARAAVSKQLAEAVDDAVSASGGLSSMVAEGRASSSADSAALQRFAAGR